MSNVFRKKNEKLSFFAKYCPKKMAKSPKNHSKPLNWISKSLIDLEPVVVLHKNRINPTKRCGENIYTEMKAERCHGWEKNEIIFTCLSANRLHSARPENALHLKRTLARLLIYDGAQPEKHCPASPGNAKDVMKPRLSLFFVPLDKKSSEESTSLKGNYYFRSIANKFLRKVRSKSKLEKNPINIHFAWNVPQLNWHASLWGKLNVLNFW